MTMYSFDSKSSYLDFTEKSGLEGIIRYDHKDYIRYYIRLTKEQEEIFEDLLRECGAWPHYAED